MVSFHSFDLFFRNFELRLKCSDLITELFLRAIFYHPNIEIAAFSFRISFRASSRYLCIALNFSLYCLPSSTFSSLVFSTISPIRMI